MNSKPLPPPVARHTTTSIGAAAPNGQPKVDAGSFAISTGLDKTPQRIGIHGPGGVGKSTLVSLLPGRTLFLDIERSTSHLDVERIKTISTFAELRGIIQSSAIDPYDSIVIDSGTKAEELAIAHVVSTVAHEKGGRVTSLEGYGFGRGYQYVYDAFLLLLADLDRAVDRGKNVVVICHTCTSDVPNPSGEDFLRWEPRLQGGKSGKSSIRNRFVEWADHVLFIGYDVFSEDGKGKGGGTRTIWTQERPDHIAKSRCASAPVPFNDKTDGSIWASILSPQEGGAS